MNRLNLLHCSFSVKAMLTSSLKVIALFAFDKDICGKFFSADSMYSKSAININTSPSSPQLKKIKTPDKKPRIDVTKMKVQEKFNHMLLLSISYLLDVP